MSNIVNFCNINSGFIMAILTFVYVIATIAICFFNWKATNAAKEQVSEQKNQMSLLLKIQQQNIDLQLFEKRFDLAIKADCYFSENVIKVQKSLLSICDKFESENLNLAEYVKIKFEIIQLFGSEYEKKYSEFNQELIECNVLLKKMKNYFSELYYIYYKGGEYDELILKIENYFRDFKNKILDYNSLEKALQSIGCKELFDLFKQTNTKIEKLNGNFNLESLMTKCSNNCFSFLKADTL